MKKENQSLLDELFHNKEVFFSYVFLTALFGHFVVIVVDLQTFSVRGVWAFLIFLRIFSYNVIVLSIKTILPEET